MSQHLPKSNLIASALVIACCALCVPQAALAADTAKPSQALTGASRVTPAFLAEVRAQAASRLKLSPSQIDALTSKLRSMNFNQVGALVTGNASALQGLVTGMQGSTVDAATAGATRGAVSQAGVEPGASGNATERMLGDARTLRGGFSDGGAGQVSAKGSCDACAANFTAGSQNNTDPSGDENKRDVPLSAGGTAYVYPDGSFVIKDASGKQEVYDSNYRERTNDPRWTANKTPVPDGEGGRRSGLISAAEWRTLLGKIGSKGAPQTGTATGAGGTKPGSRTTAGTPIELSTARVVDTAQLKEVLRVAVEKLGPKLR
jgi:hypothetical protein